MVEDCMTREEEVCEDVTTMECRVVEKKACTTVTEPVSLTSYYDQHYRVLC